MHHIKGTGSDFNSNFWTLSHFFIFFAPALISVDTHFSCTHNATIQLMSLVTVGIFERVRAEFGFLLHPPLFFVFSKERKKKPQCLNKRKQVAVLWQTT